MVTTKIKDSLKQAITDLKIAEYESNRPEEDMVTLSVCLTARQTMNEMLRLYLLSQNINHNAGKSMSDLLNQCKAIDKKFDAIDVSKILCNNLNHSECENKYCLSTENVSNCMAAAQQVKSIVLDSLELAEKELE